jgi:glycosyltransferase involved in cell wall biosynthesis
MVGHKGEVLVDANGQSPISSLEQYRSSVNSTTWDAVTHYAQSVSQRRLKMAFFSATPQGGGVALMRHALVRFLRTLGVDCKWYVPRPRPEVFRITKTNHNILQGVADPEERLSKAQQQILDEWVQTNVAQKWGKPGGPLAARQDGGADFIVVDDPQMPGLVSIAKEVDPGRPVVFRSHIQVRADLAHTKGTPTAEVWDWVWERVKQADVFVSHPVKAFVPSNVTFDKVAWLPATTDWLDGLNKELATYDSQHYIHDFNTACFQQQMPPLAYPARDYIAQIARFDPSKGIPDVLASYALLRRKYMKDYPQASTPQLVIAGHGSVDDPDASRIFDHTLRLLDTTYADIASDVILQRVGPTDQLLNAVLSHAKVALQLSTREGFEVKVSEALHKGVPVIATRAGGIPLQVRDGEGGYLVEVGDCEAVARHLFELFDDEDLYARMSGEAKRSVGDEVGTVGNALAWLYLADALTEGERVVPRGRWVNDLAREKCGVLYQKGENRLPRNVAS